MFIIRFSIWQICISRKNLLYLFFAIGKFRKSFQERLRDLKKQILTRYFKSDLTFSMEVIYLPLMLNPRNCYGFFVYKDVHWNFTKRFLLKNIKKDTLNFVLLTLAIWNKTEFQNKFYFTLNHKMKRMNKFRWQTGVFQVNFEKP